MKTVKVFIASSDELRIERLEFSDLILQMNRILKPRGLEIEPVKWEYLDASMGPLCKQEEYNRELKTCEMCLVLYWRRFGDYTKSELDTAYSELCAGRNPRKLYIYFKEAEDISQELKDFKESFSTDYGHFFCRFENVDTMKLNFLLQFEQFMNQSAVPMLKVRDSKVEIDGTPLVELGNIPFVESNPEYHHLLRDIRAKQQMVLKYPQIPDLRQELNMLQDRREAMEQSLLDTAKLITRLSTETTSVRLSEAMRLFEMGDNKGADAVLNLDEIKQDALSNANRLDALKEMEADALKALESNIMEYRMKIKTLQNSMEEGWVQKAVAVYGEAITIARNRISPEKFAGLLLAYADFVCGNKQYHLVGSTYEEALSIYRSLATQNSEDYECDVAGTLNNLAILHYDIRRFDEAEQEYEEALKICRELAEKNPETFEYVVALTLNNLANLHYCTQRFDEAEQEYEEALKISHKLAEKNPAFESDVIRTLNNLAVLQYGIQRYDKAEQEYEEALKVSRKLAERNPAFASDVARTLNNLAILQYGIQCYDKAERNYEEALKIHRDLAEKNPDAFKGDVAQTLNNLANLHSDIQHFDEAEREYLEALKIYQDLAEKNPEAFASDVAWTLNNLAILHMDNDKPEIALTEFKEALEIYKRVELTTGIPNERVKEIEDILNELQK